MTDAEFQALAERVASQTQKLAGDIRAQQQKASEILAQDHQTFVELLTNGITEQNAEPRPAG